MEVGDPLADERYNERGVYNDPPAGGDDDVAPYGMPLRLIGCEGRDDVPTPPTPIPPPPLPPLPLPLGGRTGRREGVADDAPPNGVKAEADGSAEAAAGGAAAAEAAAGGPVTLEPYGLYRLGEEGVT